MPAVSMQMAWGFSLALLSMLIFAACLVVVSSVMKSMNSGPGSLLAAAAGVPVGLLLASVQLLLQGGMHAPGAWAVTAFVLAGIGSTYLGRWLVFRTIELLGPSAAAGLQSISPLFTAFFGWIFLGEHVGALGFAGMALGIVGLVSMSVGISQGKPPAAGAAASRRGMAVLATMLFGLGSAAAYASSHVFRASAVRQWNEPLVGATLGTLAGTLALLFANRARLAGYAREIRGNPRASRIYFAVGAMQFAAQALVIASMRFIPASVAALISMCTPLGVMPISYFVLRKREKLAGATVFGICVTLAGMVLIVLYGRAGT